MRAHLEADVRHAILISVERAERKVDCLLLADRQWRRVRYGIIVTVIYRRRAVIEHDIIKRKSLLEGLFDNNVCWLATHIDKVGAGIRHTVQIDATGNRVQHIGGIQLLDVFRTHNLNWRC